MGMMGGRPPLPQTPGSIPPDLRTASGGYPDQQQVGSPLFRCTRADVFLCLGVFTVCTAYNCCYWLRAIAMQFVSISGFWAGVWFWFRAGHRI